MSESIEQIELNFRTKAILTPKLINSEQKLIAKVIYEELFLFFDAEKKVKGQHLRKPCDFEKNQLYHFPTLNGITLEELIINKTALSIEEITDIFKQLLIGLHELHQQGFLGRCFTIQNVYIEQNQIKLSAFGFYPNLQLTPPEFLQNQSYSLGIDIWLLGCLLYQLLTSNIIQNFKTFEDYNNFYTQLNKKVLQKEFASILVKMLNPNEQKRITFGDLHSIFKCIPQNDHIREFYRTQLSLVHITISIKQRESFNPEWAVPKEFNEKTKIKIFTTKYQKQNEHFIGQDSDPNFMSLYNKSDEEKNQFSLIWRELHFYYYKFFILENQMHYLQCIIQFPHVVWTRFCILNMTIILKREFLILIQEKINFLKVTENEWNSFLKNSKQLQKHIFELQAQISQQIIKLENQTLEIDCKQFDMITEEKQLLLQLKMEGGFKNTSQLNRFEQFKVPYRRCLQHCYYELEKILEDQQELEDQKFYARLRLQLIICMTINRVFDMKFDNNKQHRDINFQELKKTLKISQLTCPSQVHHFLLNASLDQLKQQTYDIHKLFFNNVPFMNFRNQS
ncbi:unnamed protein product [Paramecium sonneborni]|uniref:Protein kinase domain-containing protein n=1 Tax=Paramecium sonneborni TaxID=65129 RepID=A0A8S1RBT0_9CILI|nr:unnamed protein product [Paramecium sonneborni]